MSDAAKPYTPELGQGIFGCPTGAYECPEWMDALVAGILSEIDRVFWNRNQRQWDEHEDPRIPGVHFRAYWWGDDDAAEASAPNLAHGGIEVRWYKHPGRGTSLNRPVTPDEAAQWYGATLAAIRATDPRDD